MKSSQSQAFEVRWAGVVRLLLGLVLFGALLTLVDLRRLWVTLASANGPFLVAALAASCGATVLLEALRFQTAFARWRLSYGAALRITLAGLFVGSFTPGAVGTEMYKIYALHRREQGFVRPFVLMGLLRAIGALAVLATAAAALVAAPEKLGEIADWITWRQPQGVASVLIIGGAALTALGLLVLAFGWKRLAPRLQKAWRQGWEALKELRLRTIGDLVILSLGITLLRGLSLALLVQGFGERARFGDLLVVVAFSVLAGMLPISPAGLGVQEGILAGCLMLLHIPQPVTVAIALVNRAFLWLFAAAGGWALAISKKAPPTTVGGGL
jgi:uncharacterized membrane protein YbhN (UPF0104 family)